MRAALAISLLITIAAPVAAQEAEPARVAGALPRAFQEEDLQRLDARLAEHVAELRTRTDLGRGFQPRYLFGQGAATRVVLPDGQPAWITSHAHLAAADTVHIRIDGEWRQADVRHATGMFDLALVAPAGLAPEGESTLFDDNAETLGSRQRWSPASTMRARDVSTTTTEAGQGTPPIDIANEWPSGGAVLSYVTGEHVEGPRTIVFGLGQRPRGDWSFYIRSMANVLNGHPLVAQDGSLIGIASFRAPDRHGGVFAIPFDMIRAWIEEWPQLDDSAIGWTPRVHEEQLDVRVEAGREVEP